MVWLLVCDSTHPPSVDHVVALLEWDAQDETRAWLDQLETAPASDRRTVLRSLKSVAADHPSVLAPIASAFAQFLEDDERAVRLTAAKPFVVNRARFALESVSQSDTPTQVPNEIGSVAGVRNTTDEAVDAITAPDSDGECPHCGLALPEDGPPMCPRCGAPY